MSDEEWANNSVQFPRLLSEIWMTCHISKSDWKGLCDSMDLSEDEVVELFERAMAEFEEDKERVYKEIVGDRSGDRH